MFQNTSLETLKISQSGYPETFVNSSRGPWLRLVVKLKSATNDIQKLHKLLRISFE